MTDTHVPAAPPAPTGLKAKVQGAVLKGYLRLPPPAQKAVLNGAMKVGPVVAKAGPYKRQILGGAGALLILRQLRRR